MRDPKVCWPFENLDSVGLSDFGVEMGLGGVSLVESKDALLGGVRAGVAGLVLTPGLTIGLGTDDGTSGR